MKREKGAPVMFNLRVRPTSAKTKVTKEALRKVVSYAKQHDAAPKGWEVAYIEWSHPKARGSSGWKTGDESDLGFLGRVLRKMGNVELRAAEVERSAASARKVKGWQKKADAALREQRREIKAKERLRGKEARARHQAKAAKAKAKFQRYAALLESAAEDEAEFELAVNYRGKGKR